MLTHGMVHDGFSSSGCLGGGAGTEDGVMSSKKKGTEPCRMKKAILAIAPSVTSPMA